MFNTPFPLTVFTDIFKLDISILCTDFTNLISSVRSQTAPDKISVVHLSVSTAEESRLTQDTKIIFGENIRVTLCVKADTSRLCW